MRFGLLLLLGSVATPVAAQSLSVSGGLGAGVVDDSPASVLELGVDVAGPDVQVGLGGRLAFLAEGSVRTEDWDEPGEWATIVRYLTYRKPAFDEELQVSFAAGELGGVELGYGALMDQYATGVDMDHRHLGAHARVFATDYGLSALVDDLVAPRIAAGRGYYRAFDRVYVGGALAADLVAPTGETTSGLWGGSVDISYMSKRHGRSWHGEGYAQVAKWWTLGLGAHLGTRGQVGVTPKWQLGGKAEVLVGSDEYIPGYIGPLYERNRYQWLPMQTQLERAQVGGLGGVGALSSISLQRVGGFELELTAGHRAGLGAYGRGQLVVSERERAQFAVSGNYERLGSGSSAWTVASELRWLLPANLYASARVARLYRRTSLVVDPAWWAVATVGAELGK